ncbi:hypothetical protein [Candidatus Velamenicoccus archaeovorus]|uniref:hypothetical protein n=1 Tax=Velamenicoccus archaeovorus TaxID=1930593 RepID=UPI0013E8ECFC|nr:hypothetical protein [Candidatus Velamenicoccus archaeovorus]
MMTETMFSFFWMIFLVLGVALGIAWLFLPWFLMSKMDRMIELLEKMAQEKR